MLNGASAATAPTDRSISPLTSSSTMPAAMIAPGRDGDHQDAGLAALQELLADASRDRPARPAGRSRPDPLGYLDGVAHGDLDLPFGGVLSRSPGAGGPGRGRCRSAPRPPALGGGVDHECAIAPERSTTCCWVLDPSKRVLVSRYGLTLSLVTNSRPVFVSDGKIRPPESLYRYRYSTGRKPCR